MKRKIHYYPNPIDNGETSFRYYGPPEEERKESKIPLFIVSAIILAAVTTPYFLY